MALHRKCCCTIEEDQPRLVKAGWYHFLMMTSRGYLQVFVGVPSQTNQAEGCRYETIPSEPPAWHPLKIPAAVLQKKAKDIECGAYHCVVRHSDNTIACWGLNAMGQCDVPTTSSKGNLTDPANANLKKIVGLHAGYSTTAVTFNDGTVVCWGDPEVADVVNGWTDLVMSPPKPRRDPESNAVEDLRYVEGVDAAQPQYYKPALDGAYNASADVTTYNLYNDRLEEWHSGEKPCLPMFDLGVETDPHLPLELNVEARTPIPAIGTQFPRFTPDDFLYGSETCADCEAEDGPFDPDVIEKCWRDYVFNAHEQMGEKSCCDLEIKKDFAVGMRRTGQVITTRSTNRYSSNPNPCPTGYADGRSNCRDCSGDSYLKVSTGNVSHDTGVGNPPLECQCDADRVFYYKRAADAVSLNACVPVGGFGGLQAFMFEGIGCVGAHVDTDEFGYDPNWAKSVLSMAGRWTSAEQVRNGNPAWNGGMQFGWANSRHTVRDTLQIEGEPAPDCITVHESNKTCNQLCPSHAQYDTSGTLNNADRNSKYYYPVQFYCQGIQAGTNTTHWNSTPPQLFKKGPAFGNCENGQTPAERKCLPCGDNPTPGGGVGAVCGPQRQLQTPNGGVFSYGCIYALNLDKYGYDNSWRAQTNQFDIISRSGTCAALQVFAVRWGRMGSKPWGPYHMGVRNGVGDAWNRKGNACHCCGCAIAGQDGQITASPGYPVVVAPDQPDGNVHSINGWEVLDAVIGTYMGMPYEYNWMHTADAQLTESGPGCSPDCWHHWGQAGRCCVNPTNQACNTQTPSPNPYVGACPAAGGGYDYFFSQGESSWGAVFGMYHPPRSVASARMAFAVIRPDHRAIDPATGERAIKNTNLIGVPGPAGVGGVFARDPTQYQTCSLDRDCPGTTVDPPGGEFDDVCASMCEDPRDAFQQGCVERRTIHALHLWGSLWDPCPPWPRQCVGKCYTELDGLGNPPDPAQTEPCCDPAQTDTNAPDFCCDEEPCDCDTTYCCDPAVDAACPCNPSVHGACVPSYPSWTRVPSQVQIGSGGAIQTNTVRTSAKNGSWVKVGLQWVRRFTNFSTPSYPAQPVLSSALCIDCTGHERTFETYDKETYRITNPSPTP